MSENMSVLQALWDAFLTRWPKEKIKALTLAEYVSVNDQDTFTYWLETKTKQLGSIQGNTSAKFGIYKRNGKANGQSGIGHGEVYSWRIKYGEDEQSVFDYVKQNLIAIIEAVEQGDLERIEQIDFSAMVKWKISFLYQNQHKPCLINIFSKEMLDVLIDTETKQSFPQLYRELIQLKGDSDLLQYGQKSWQRANSKRKEIWQKQIFAKFQHVRVFSRHLNTWDDQVKTAFCELIEAAYQQNLDVFTTNMASGDMIRIGRKEIGADSAESIFATFKPREQLIYSQRFKYRDEYFKEDINKQLTAKIIKSKQLAEFNEQYPITRKPYWPQDFNGKYDDIVPLSDSNVTENSEKYIMGNNPPLNQILYGPPGTGKTYSTINKALAILDPVFLNENLNDRETLKVRFDALLKCNRIGFVTFHQSFSYEDFVEGIKADSEDGQVHYSIEDGIFKSMCEAALVAVEFSSDEVEIDVSTRKIWKMSLGDTQGEDAYIYQQCIDNDYVVLGYGYKLDFSTAKSRSDVMDLYNQNGAEITNASRDYSVGSVHKFKNEMSIGDLIVVSDGNHKFRAIAEITGDYYFDDVAPESEGYTQCRKVKWHKIFSPSMPKDELLNSNFSQMTLYRLWPSVIDLDKLQNVINSDNSVNSSGLTVGSAISGYTVLSLSSEIIELRKPNGCRLPLARSIVDGLIELVKTSKITIDDIKQKRVFDKINTELEKYIVNGYQNVLASIVSEIITKGIVTDSLPIADKRILIIDEINRGNIANIFGELITLIEPSKRAGGAESLSVKLPYSKQPFSVPSNLHIIGTMNTADKSLAQVDIALRRRFEFIEMMPDYSLLTDIPDIEGINIAQMLETINQRIELLYDREHMIGHSFYLPLKETPTITKLAQIFELQILPLLEEYFFEDWERVGQVLGDHLKADQSLHFIIEKFDSSAVVKLMGDDWEQTGIQPYQRNQQALSDPQAYIGIYEAITNA